MEFLCADQVISHVIKATLLFNVYPDNPFIYSSAAVQTDLGTILGTGEETG